jgi:3-oxoacyl-[acyl-carrier-protein] synthase II
VTVYVTGTAIAPIGDERAPARARKLMSRAAELAALALRRLVRGWSEEERRDAGLFLGVGASGGEVGELAALVEASRDGDTLSLARLGQEGLAACTPLLAFQLMNNFTLCHGAILEGIGGPSGAFFSRGAGTTAALCEAIAALEAGDCARAVAGAADTSLHPVTWAELRREGHPRRPAMEAAALIALSTDPRGALCAVEDARPRGEAPAGVDAVVRVEDVPGETLAAGPALAWCAAVERIAAGARRVAVVGQGRDGDAGVVVLARSAPARRARPARVPVVTGLGVVSPFGAGAAAFLGGLAEGRSAVGAIRSFDARTFPTRVAAEVPVSPGTRDRKIGFAVLAAEEAWRAAAPGAAGEAWLCLALGLEQAFLEELTPILRDGVFDWDAAGELRSRLDRAAEEVRARLGLGGPSAVNVSACAAGALAVAQAAALVARGDAEVVVCGGADSMVNPLGIGGMSRLGAPSPRAAADACRPFDRRRDGLVIGEGAAVFVIEPEERARARGARILARVLGWGASQDAYRATAPRLDGSAARAAIERALARAGLAPRAIAYVNAHGTGTPLNDPAEARALRDAGLRGAAVSSIKGAVGHLMAAAGAIELAACLLPFTHGLYPGTAHHAEPDPECDLDVIGPAPRPVAAPGPVLSTSFGFGGQNAAVILGPPEAP